MPGKGRVKCLGLGVNEKEGEARVGYSDLLVFLVLQFTRGYLLPGSIWSLLFQVGGFRLRFHGGTRVLPFLSNLCHVVATLAYSGLLAAL